jgi:hypothetical protein
MKVRLKVGTDGTVVGEAVGEDGKVAGAAEILTDALPTGWGIENVAGLRQSLADERGARKAAEKALKAYDGIDDADIAREAVSKMKAGTLKSRDEIDAYKLEIEKKMAKDLAAAHTERDTFKKQLEETLVERDALAAITEAKGNPRLLMPVVRAAARIERNGDGKLHVALVGEDGKPLITKKAGSSDGMSLSEYVSTLKASPDYKAAFSGSGSGGAGSNSQSGGAGKAGNANGSIPDPGEFFRLANASAASA